MDSDRGEENGFSVIMPLFLWNACQLKSGLRGVDVDLGGKENHMNFLFQSLSDGFDGRQHSVQLNSTVDTLLVSQWCCFKTLVIDGAKNKKKSKCYNHTKSPRFKLGFSFTFYWEEASVWTLKPRTVVMGDFLELSSISGVSAKPLNNNRLILSQVDSKKVSKWKQPRLKGRQLKVNAHASAILYCLSSTCSRSWYQSAGWLLGNRNKRVFIHISMTSQGDIVSTARCSIQDVVT